MDIITDALKEVINIGTAQAANALSEMLNKKISINIPDMKLLPLAEVPQHLGGAETPIVGIYFQINGPLGGRIFLIFDKPGGHRLATLLTGNTAMLEGELDELGVSALMELGNILSNSYINAIANLLDVSISPSVPYFSEDMLGAAIDYLLIEISQVADSAILFTTDIMVESENLKGNFLVFPDAKFMARISEKLGL